MTGLTKNRFPLSMPKSLKAAAARLADRDGVSLNQWINTIVALRVGKEISASEFLAKEAEGATLDDFRAVLHRYAAQASANEPQEIKAPEFVGKKARDKSDY